MKVIEKFNYSLSDLRREFKKFSTRHGRYLCDTWASDVRNALEDERVNSSADAFMSWAWGEYPNYRQFQIIEGSYIVVDPKPDEDQNITVVDVFSSGWQFHCDMLKKLGKDVSKPYLDHERKANMYDIVGYNYDGTCKRVLTNEQVIEKIDGSLRELGVLRPAQDGYQYLVNPRDCDKPFYKTYIDTIKHLKKQIQVNCDEWEDINLLSRMGLGKWIPVKEGGAK